MQDRDTSHPRWGITLGATACMSAGLVPVYFVPFFIGILEQDRNLTTDSASVIGSAEIAATAITTMLLGRIRPNLNFTYIVLAGACLSGIANFGSVDTRHSTLLLLLRVVAGIGSGLFLGSATIAIARQAMPARVYGRVFGLCAVFFTGSMLLLPVVLEKAGATGYFFSEVVIAVAAAASFPAFRDLSAHLSVLKVSAKPDVKLTTLLYIVLVALFLPIGGWWGLAEQIAHTHGLSLRTIGVGLAVSNAAGFLGGELSRRVGLRFGVFWPTAACAAGLVLVSLGLLVSDRAVIFVSVMGLLGVIYLFSISHLVSTAAVLDRSGALSSGLNGSNLIALSIGTAAFGALLGRFGLLTVLFANLVVCSAALPSAWIIGSALHSTAHTEA